MNEKLVKGLETLLEQGVEKVIDIKESESTNSVYVLAELKSEKVVEVSFSDHEADKHGNWFEASDFDDDFYESVSDTKFNENEDIYYYGIEYAKDYSLDKRFLEFTSEKMVGKKSFDRLLAFLSYTIRSAEYLYQSQVLKVEYDDGEIAYYTNYNPIEIEASESDIAKVAYIEKNMQYININLKKYFYNLYSETKEEAAENDEMWEGSSFGFDGEVINGILIIDEN